MVPLLAVVVLNHNQNFGDPHWTGRDVAAEDNCKERVIEEQSKASKGSKFCPNGAEYV